MQTIDKKEQQTNLTCIHTVCLVYAYFLSIACKSIICVSNDTNYCAFSIVHIIIILLAQYIIYCIPFCLYTLICLQLIYF